MKSIPMVKIDTKAILNRFSDIEDRLQKNDIPQDVQKNFETVLRHAKDGITGLQGRHAVDEAIDELRGKNIPHAIAAIDFRNLGGLNDTFQNHEEPNAIIKEIINDNLVPAVREKGGEVYRSGGDEYHVIVPYMKSAELKKLMSTTVKTIDETVIKKHQLACTPHPKHYGLPTGVGLDYGCADQSKGKNRSEALKKADAQCFANKMKYKNKVVAHEMESGREWVLIDKTFAPKNIADALNKFQKEIEHERPSITGTISQGRDYRSDVSGVSQTRNGERGSGRDRFSNGINQIGTSSRRSEEKIIGKPEAAIGEKNSPDFNDLMVNTLKEYASKMGVAVPDEVLPTWKQNLERGENPQAIADYIKAYSSQLTSGRGVVEKPVSAVAKSNSGMDI